MPTRVLNFSLTTSFHKVNPKIISEIQVVGITLWNVITAHCYSAFKSKRLLIPAYVFFLKVELEFWTNFSNSKSRTICANALQSKLTNCWGLCFYRIFARQWNVYITAWTNAGALHSTKLCSFVQKHSIYRLHLCKVLVLDNNQGSWKVK
jgi:hypothetical protein